MAELTAETFNSLKKSVDILNKNIVKFSNDVIKQRKLEESQKGLDLELAKEQEQRDETIIEWLNIIAGNTEQKPGEKDAMKDFGWGKALMLAVAGLAGFILAKLKILQTAFKMLQLDKLLVGLKGAFTRLFQFLGESKLGKWFTTKLDAIKAGWAKSLTKISNLFKIGEGGLIGKAITGVKSFFTGIGKALTPLVEAVAWLSKMSGISKLLSGVKTFFTGMMEWVGKFGSAFGGVVKVIGKIFAPFLWIMGIYEAVKGAIGGFEEDGWLGAITGAIKEFFSFVFFQPLDMIKSLISWVAGLFGLEKVEKFLDSFSFEDIWRSLVDGVTKFIKKIVYAILPDGLAEKIVGPKDEIDPRQAQENAANKLQSTSAQIKSLEQSNSDIFNNYGTDFGGDIMKSDHPQAKRWREQADRIKQLRIQEKEQLEELKRLSQQDMEVPITDDIDDSDQKLDAAFKDSDYDSEGVYKGNVKDPRAAEKLMALDNEPRTSDLLDKESSEVELAKSNKGGKGNVNINQGPQTNINANSTQIHRKPAQKNEDHTLQKYKANSYGNGWT